MSEFIKVTNHQANPIDLRHIDRIIESRPIELHYNENGSIEDKPSFAIVLKLPSNLKTCGQFSLKTLETCLDELGYKITKK